MKQVKEMDKKELMNHMFALVSEVQFLYTMLEPHDTGHIHTTIGLLKRRIDDIKDCLSNATNIKEEDDMSNWHEGIKPLKKEVDSIE